MTSKEKKHAAPSGMGRPALPEDEKRTKRVTIVLREDELKLIAEKAQEAGETVSNWGRKTLLKVAEK